MDNVQCARTWVPQGVVQGGGLRFRTTLWNSGASSFLLHAFEYGYVIHSVSSIIYGYIGCLGLLIKTDYLLSSSFSMLSFDVYFGALFEANPETKILFVDPFPITNPLICFVPKLAPFPHFVAHNVSEISQSSKVHFWTKIE